jgi:ABC-2 type transport system ATP-binding protein
MIETDGLTKRYGARTAVDRLTIRVRPGVVTGFLGPNGAGKSTTLRLVVGLDRPTAGHATVGGRPYASLAAPLREVGTLLDADALHPGRTAAGHLRWLARSNGLPGRRVDEVLGLVGLAAVAGRRTGAFSLGMRQRLGLAAALLGDPGVLVLDEPVNGLDPEGVRSIRTLLRGLAAEGRTVLLSSHLMSEMELTADHLLVIGRGRLLADTSMGELLARHSAASTLVRTGRPDRLRELLAGAGARVEPTDRGLLVSGPDAAAIGELAARAGIALHELSPRRSSLEEVYLRMTAADTEHAAPAGAPAVAA